MRTCRSAPVAIAIMYLVIILVCSNSGTAQYRLPLRAQHPELYTTIQDSLTVFLIAGGGDTLRREWVSGGYQFDMLYDSTIPGQSVGMVTAMYTEFKKNGELLKLAKWLKNRRVNANPDLLSSNSRTDTFTVHSGDTLSLYRDIMWNDPRRRYQDTSNYYALDSLDYVVELVRLSDSMRIALVDSIGILPSAEPGRPRIHGMRPLMASVHYVAPPALEGTRAFLRILLYHRGNGEQWFTRTDVVTLGLSLRLTDTLWQNYIALFGHGLLKQPVERLMQLQGAGKEKETRLDVENIAGSKDVTITFTPDSDGGSTAVAIYDINGQVVFFPSMASADDGGNNQVRYRFESGGVYFVGLLHRGRLITSQKIYIQE
jgi:hypothetical protein